MKNRTKNGIEIINTLNRSEGPQIKEINKYY